MPIDTTPGSSTAVAYGSVAEADAYFAARGIAAWSNVSPDTEKEQALVRGCDYIENTYRSRWRGTAIDDDQALSWPRAWVSDPNGYPYQTNEVPELVKRANFEAALLVIQGTALEPNLERGGAVKRSMAKAGPAEVETEWESGASARTKFTAIDGLLECLVYARSQRLLRA